HQSDTLQDRQGDGVRGAGRNHRRAGGRGSGAKARRDSVTGLSIEILLRAAAIRLKAAGIEAPMREARLLLGHAAGLGQSTLIGWPARAIEDEAAGRFQALVERRLAREPVARILGRREFWSL